MNGHALSRHLFFALDFHFRALRLEFGAVLTEGIDQKLLIFLAQRIKIDCAGRRAAQQHKVAGLVDVGANLIKAARIGRGALVFAAVNRLLLDTRIDFALAHRRAHSAHRVHGRDAQIAAHRANLQTVQIRRNIDFLVADKVPRAAVPVAGQHLDAIRFKLLFPVGNRLRARNLVDLGVIRHDIRHLQNAVFRNVVGQTAGVRYGQDRRALNGLFKDIIRVAQSGIRKHFDVEVAVGRSFKRLFAGIQLLAFNVGVRLRIRQRERRLLPSRKSRRCRHDQRSGQQNR